MSTAPDLNAAFLDVANLPTDPDALAAMLEGVAAEAATNAGIAGSAAGAEDATSTQAETTSATAGADEAGAGAAQSHQTQEQKQTDDASTAEGVATKDGKGVIPFHVLSSTRERATRAELRARELEAELEAFRAGGGSAQAAGTTAAGHALSDEDMAALREEAPHLAAVIDSMSKQLATQAQAIAAVQKPAAEQQREAEVQRILTAQEQVEEAVASVPKLQHLRTHDAAAFNEVAEIDTFLRKQDRWAKAPMAERFAKAVSMYEAANGPVSLPGAAAAAAAAPAAAQRAAQTVAAAQATPAAPSTLSDIPGGAVPPGSSAEALTDVNADSLAHQFMGMTPDQINGWLARHAV